METDVATTMVCQSDSTNAGTGPMGLSWLWHRTVMPGSEFSYLSCSHGLRREFSSFMYTINYSNFACYTVRPVTGISVLCCSSSVGTALC